MFQAEESATYCYVKDQLETGKMFAIGAGQRDNTNLKREKEFLKINFKKSISYRIWSNDMNE